MVSKYTGSVGSNETLYNITATKNGSVRVKATLSNDIWSLYTVSINGDIVSEVSANGNTSNLAGMLFVDEVVVYKGQTVTVAGNRLVYLDIASNL